MILISTHVEVVVEAGVELVNNDKGGGDQIQHIVVAWGSWASEDIRTISFMSHRHEVNKIGHIITIREGGA